MFCLTGKSVTFFISRTLYERLSRNALFKIKSSNRSSLYMVIIGCSEMMSKIFPTHRICMHAHIYLIASTSLYICCVNKLGNEIIVRTNSNGCWKSTRMKNIRYYVCNFFFSLIGNIIVLIRIMFKKINEKKTIWDIFEKNVFVFQWHFCC